VQRILFSFLTIWLTLSLGLPHFAFAKNNKPQQGVQQSILAIDNTIKAVKNKDFTQADHSFQLFKEQWFQMQSDIRKDSLNAYGKIETKMASTSVALLNQDQQKAEESLQALKSLLTQYAEGQLGTETTSAKKVNIPSYLKLLEATKESLSNRDIAKGKVQVEELKSQWLSVEGDVVGQSKTVYNNSERRLVLLSSYVAAPDTISKAVKIIDQMIGDLTPLAHTSYGIWDAALIPIREGLEALLVIGALLTFTKRGEVRKGSRLVWGGTILGLLSSLAIGFLVSYALSSASFGRNNFLINGWSGVIASLMLLYVSYWLHRNSNIKRWNAFMNRKTEKALSNGKMLSFAVLAFLAVLREGIETVIFLIGMTNQMSWAQLAAGITLGFGVLIVIGVLMLKLSVRLPLKPFFLVSSVIVFYLCLKFMGSGIHSLQLSGFIPSTASDNIPTIHTLGVYPSWYSTLPQLVIVGLSLSVILFQQRKQSKDIKSNQEAI
jgi:high-affinity iron transporter